MASPKNNRIDIRLSDEEKALLAQLAERENIGKSTYVRNLIKNQERAFTLSNAEMEKFRKEYANLTRLGNNINQIAYYLNSSQLSPDATTKNQDMESLFLQTKRSVEELKNQMVVLYKEKSW
jgi:hypothetical protein